MSKLEKIRQSLKKDGLWKNYKTKFQHHQMRLLFSKVVIELKLDFSSDFLIAEEKILLATKASPTMFVSSFKKLSKGIAKGWDWKTFGVFVWYVYQTSTYWKDLKSESNNIFKKDIIEGNAQKRAHYAKWLDSIPEIIDRYNQTIIKIMKLVF